MSEPLMTISIDNPTYGRKRAKEVAARTGGTVLEGPFHAFVLASDGATLGDAPQGMVYKTYGSSYPGDLELMHRDAAMDKILKRAEASGAYGLLVTDDPRKLKGAFERETGFALGPRLEETGSAGVGGDKGEEGVVEHYLISTKGNLMKKGEPIGRLDVQRMTHQQFETAIATQPPSPKLKIDLKNK